MFGTSFVSSVIILWIFCIVAKAPITLVLSVRPSVHVYQPGFKWTAVREILYCEILWKSIKKIQVSIKSNKQCQEFSWRPKYIYVAADDIKSP